ncbi:MAG: phosphatase PAP2 family protein [Planctomycetota bacterium]
MRASEPVYRLVDLTIVAFWILWTTLALTAPGEVKGRWPWCLAGLAIAALAFWMPRLLGDAGERRVFAVRATFTSVAILSAFTQLGFVIPGWSERTFEPQLIAIDRWMFGVDPTIWMGRFARPWLTELLQLVYSTFYFLPFVLGFFLYREGRWRELAKVFLAVALGFYLSYIGYLLVPARSPVYPLHDGEALPGLWLTQHVWTVLSSLEANKLDAFPSGHTEVTLVLMILAYRTSRRRAFPILAILGSLLIFSTVYLRYHYVIDVVVGIALALVVVWLTGFLVAFSERSAQTGIS